MSPSTAAVASSPKLLDRVRWHLRVKQTPVRGPFEMASTLLLRATRVPSAVAHFVSR